MLSIKRIVVTVTVISFAVVTAAVMPNAISTAVLRSDFENSINEFMHADFEQIKTVKFNDWRAETKVCPYATVEFSLSKVAGLPGNYKESLNSDDENGIIFRRGDGQTTLITFSRQTLDLCGL